MAKKIKKTYNWEVETVLTATCPHCGNDQIKEMPNDYCVGNTYECTYCYESFEIGLKK